MTDALLSFIAGFLAVIAQQLIGIHKEIARFHAAEGDTARRALGGGNNGGTDDPKE